MCERRGEPPKGRHPFLRDDLTFQALQFGKILKVENVAARLVLGEPQWRNGQADVTSRAVGSTKFYFFPQSERASLLVKLNRPKSGKHIFNLFTPEQPESQSGNLGARSVHQQDLAVQIRGEQAATHGLDDVLIECLQILQFLVFFRKLHSLRAERLREETAQVRYGAEREQIAG